MLLTILLAVWLKKVNIAVMWWKNILTMNLWRNKEDNKDFENSPKSWICYNDYIDTEIKVEVILISLENIKVLHIETVISMLS